MARIVLGTYAFRYPLGGNLSWTLQWAVGFQRLGHDVFLVEKAAYSNACFDPIRKVTSDDCSYAVGALPPLLARHQLDRRWCYVDFAGNYFGVDRDSVETMLRSADLFIDLGTHGAWLDELSTGGCKTVLVDGEPGYTQMRRENKLERGERVAVYDHYFSNGASLPTAAYTGPTAGLCWESVFNPVVVDLFPQRPPPAHAPFSTVMNWQAHAVLHLRGESWQQKDAEFAKFMDLPGRTNANFDIAIAGNAPREALHAAGWRIRSGHEATRSYDSYREYLADSAGEFSVCKQAYVALNTGWFSDRSAAYLASGRPVVMQETGFSQYLPCGAGLFAVKNVHEAADAIRRICADYEAQSAAARRIAVEHLDARHVLRRMLGKLGID